jgi:tubulin-specific chaperone A
VDKLIAEGADEADVRKQKEVLEETVQMIPDVKRRLAAAVQELSTMVVSNGFIL